MYGHRIRLFNKDCGRLRFSKSLRCSIYPTKWSERRKVIKQQISHTFVSIKWDIKYCLIRFCNIINIWIETFNSCTCTTPILLINSHTDIGILFFLNSCICRIRFVIITPRTNAICVSRICNVCMFINLTEQYRMFLYLNAFTFMRMFISNIKPFSWSISDYFKVFIIINDNAKSWKARFINANSFFGCVTYFQSKVFCFNRCEFVSSVLTWSHDTYTVQLT